MYWNFLLEILCKLWEIFNKEIFTILDISYNLHNFENKFLAWFVIMNFFIFYIMEKPTITQLSNLQWGQVISRKTKQPPGITCCGPRKTKQPPGITRSVPFVPDFYGSWVINLFPYVWGRWVLSQEKVVLRHTLDPKVIHLNILSIINYNL